MKTWWYEVMPLLRADPEMKGYGSYDFSEALQMLATQGYGYIGLFKDGRYTDSLYYDDAVALYFDAHYIKY